MPDFSTLLPFVAAALALNLTPGADMTYVIARSATQGRAAGIAASFGVAAGSLVHSLLAAFGVAALVARSEAAFLTIKVAGALYLLYLAGKAFRAGAQGLHLQALQPVRLGRVFAEGALTNLLNPKVALFILAFLPQFVDPMKGSVIVQILVLGLIFNIGGTTVNVVVAASAGAAAGMLRNSASFGRWLNRVSGVVFIGLALRLAFAERR
ncbi:MAG TPA: LysE family translocator [Dongiaceae bacterium]|nr:LysE family translocator [Dongiaceae bacterium]